MFNNHTLHESRKLTETFYNLNGRNPSDEELLTLQENIHFNDEDDDNDDIINNTINLNNQDISNIEQL